MRRRCWSRGCLSAVVGLRMRTIDSLLCTFFPIRHFLSLFCASNLCVFYLSIAYAHQCCSITHPSYLKLSRSLSGVSLHLSLLALSINCIVRPVTRGLYRPNHPFREPPSKVRPPQTFQLHIWHRIPIMPIPTVVPPIQHTEPSSWVLL